MMTKKFWGLAALVFLLLGPASASAVSCSDVWVDAQDVELERNETDYFYFPIYNDSGEDFTVLEARAYRSFGDFEVSLVDYPDEVRAFDEGELTVKIETPRLDERSYGEAYIKIRGQFENGRHCHFSSIPEAVFEVEVEKSPGPGFGCDDIEINAKNVNLGENSSKRVFFSIGNGSSKGFELYDIELDEGSSFFEAAILGMPSFVDAKDSEAFEVRIESGAVSRDRQGSVTVKVMGEFEEGSYCNYSDTREQEFTVTVENYSDARPGGTCGEINLDIGTIRLEKGQTVEAKAWLENDSDEDFFIDFVEATSRSISVEPAGYERRIDAFDAGYVRVRVKAGEHAGTGSQEAELEIFGHFQGGKSCRIYGEYAELSIIVEEKSQETWPLTETEKPACTNFSLTAPESQTIQGQGAVPIRIDNRTMERATVRLYGPGLTLEPQLISVPRYSSVSETVQLSSALEETTLVYSFDALGCSQSGRTRILNTAMGAQGQEGLEALSTGFAVLGQAAAILGALVIVGIVVYFILRP